MQAGFYNALAVSALRSAFSAAWIAFAADSFMASRLFQPPLCYLFICNDAFLFNTSALNRRRVAWAVVSASGILLSDRYSAPGANSAV
jgi:hypothetical protein